jgi:hypothetical protein
VRARLRCSRSAHQLSKETTPRAAELRAVGSPIGRQLRRTARQARIFAHADPRFRHPQAIPDVRTCPSPTIRPSPLMSLDMNRVSDTLVWQFDFTAARRHIPGSRVVREPVRRVRNCAFATPAQTTAGRHPTGLRRLRALSPLALRTIWRDRRPFRGSATEALWAVPQLVAIGARAAHR